VPASTTSRSSQVSITAASNSVSHPHGLSTNSAQATESSTVSGTWSAGITTKSLGSLNSNMSSTSAQYTISTVYTTIEYTITSCHSAITNCPVGHVTTDTISLYTTICPVTPPAAPASTIAAPPETTSTIFTTVVYKITSCQPTVTNCPMGRLTTNTISVYTTVCPAEPTPEPTEPAYVIGILVTIIIDITVELVVNEINGLTGLSSVFLSTILQIEANRLQKQYSLRKQS
jgi:chitinase